MTSAIDDNAFITFTSGLRASEPTANYWICQVALRLRREVAWCWHERGALPGDSSGALPPFTDGAGAVLDISRFAREKKAFQQSDSAARYLSDLIAEPLEPLARPVRGSFSWAVDELKLDDVSAFVLALALATVLDGSMGSVIATCLNDASRVQPTLALAQRLWDRPHEVLSLADRFHPLLRCGLLHVGSRNGVQPGEIGWDAPLTVPSLVARELLFPELPLPYGLRQIESGGPYRSDAGHAMQVVATRLAAGTGRSLRIVPVLGPRWSDYHGVVRQMACLAGMEVVEHDVDAAFGDDPGYIDALATYCWLRGLALFIRRGEATHQADGGNHIGIASAMIPATLFLAVSDRKDLASLPERLLQPIVEVPVFTYADRVVHWRRALGSRLQGLEQAVAECARRYRYEREVIDRIAEGLHRLTGELTEENLLDGCRAELDLDLGELAVRVRPRFNQQELILPHKQQVQFDEHIQAMRSLTEVHYNWGTAQAWGESGISVLFAGPPGTGKTMAAEVLAEVLGLPMYRIDLSQVVNKYIGETEKNLKRVFDAADAADMILFFDEADALFGKRTEVSDSKDRYANLEVSYLLERMERFRGLAILATNRKKDLDDAFLRRLRYIIDFPLPEAEERRRIWGQMMPANVDASGLDLHFLADRFQIAGGNIRSVIFNACLQCADGSMLGVQGKSGRLTMAALVIALKREYEKMGRTISLEQFGPYGEIIRRLDHE